MSPAFIRIPIFAIFAYSIIAAFDHSAGALTLEIGISSAKAKRQMLNHGYSNIQIYDKNFKTIRATGCKDGVLYNLYVNHEMEVRVISEAGTCQSEITIEEARDSLSEDGFSQIDIFEKDGRYIALACRADKRLRVIMDASGKVLQQNGIGQCENVLQPNDIAVLLRKRGYNRINFTDRQLPWYVAEACKDGRRLELRLNRRGDIREENRIGACSAPLKPGRIAEYLEAQGYNRVNIIDDKLPKYVAEACRRSSRVEVSLDRFGSILKEVGLGRCPGPLDKEQIVTLLTQEGFKRIQVEELGNKGFRLSACIDGRELIVRLTRYGEIIRQREGKVCEARSLDQIGNELSGRGLKKLRYYVEACRDKRLIRFEFDALGDQINRERIGSCN